MKHYLSQMWRVRNLNYLFYSVSTYQSLKRTLPSRINSILRHLLNAKPAFNDFKGPVFNSTSRNGFIHLFGIIKWLDFIQKWDFYNIFITKKHTFLYIWPKVEYWIPQDITKKCHELSWIFNGISKIILILFAN